MLLNTHQVVPYFNFSLKRIKINHFQARPEKPPPNENFNTHKIRPSVNSAFHVKFKDNRRWVLWCMQIVALFKCRWIGASLVCLCDNWSPVFGLDISIFNCSAGPTNMHEIPGHISACPHRRNRQTQPCEYLGSNFKPLPPPAIVVGDWERESNV